MGKVGITSTGFKYEITDAAMNDAELLDALVEADEGNAVSMIRAITKLLGKDQKKRLYDHVRNDDGIVPILGELSLVSEITEIMQSDPVKNS